MAPRRVLVKMIPLASSLVLNSCRTWVLSLDRLLFSYSGLFANFCSSSLYSARQSPFSAVRLVQRISCHGIFILRENTFSVFLK